MRILSFLVFLLIVAVSTADAQENDRIVTTKAETEFLQALSGLQSNSISDIVIHDDLIWLGTNKGLAFSRDGGETWKTFTNDDGLGRGGVTGIAVRVTESDTLIWVATQFDSLTTDAGSLPAGDGLAFSHDVGASWTHVPQPGPTPVQNVTYDLALRGDEVWIASFGGGTQRSRDFGNTWEVVPPDSFIFAPLCNLNHRAFAVINADGVLWVGTAGAVDKSLDGGKTWTSFSHQSMPQSISGNFVVALARQKYRHRELIWAATVQVTDTSQQGCDKLLFPGSADQFRAVSVTEDGGYTWRTTLDGLFAHNFAFDDSVVYVATDVGVYKSLDFGQTWAHFPDIVDRQQNIAYLSQEVYAVGVGRNHTLFVAGPDGLAKTADDGHTWHIMRGSVPAGSAGEPRTYAYPSPFSPLRHNLRGNDGHIRFQYNTQNVTTVTIRVYDFTMELVAEVASGVQRPANGNFFEVWNGRNTNGDVVANGVYFYSIELAGDGTYWGKFIVMN